jgi:hypothetical protein
MNTGQDARMTDEDGENNEEQKGCYIRAGGFGCVLLSALVVLAGYGLYRLIIR